MSFVFHGIGTTTYGQRDYWPDGSFITTEWFVIGWVPIVPLGSQRVSYTPSNPRATFDQRSRFYVYETFDVDWRQALSVYLWSVFAFGPVIVWIVFEDTISKRLGDQGRDWAAGLCLVLMALACVFPYLLRRRVKRRNLDRWRRQALGLTGPDP